MKLFTFSLVIMAVTLSNSLFDDKRPSNEIFTIRLLASLTSLELPEGRDNSKKSIVFSGYSALCPLVQLGLSSVGVTQQEIFSATNLPNNAPAIIASFSEINRMLQAVEGIELKIANRLYVANNLQINQNFALESSAAFNSEVTSIDFTQPEQAANEINKWVDEKTGHRITKLVQPNMLDQLTAIAVLNAIYFKGDWIEPFDQKLTSTETFHSDNGDIQVQGMHRTGVYKYGEMEHAKILELPYNGRGISLLIVLPDPNTSIYFTTGIFTRLPETLSEAVEKMQDVNTEVMIPKFKIESTIDLKPFLKFMNITKLFKSGEAELDNLIANRKDVFISTAIQKVFFEVNEAGSEAAAASGFIGGLGYAPPPPDKKYFIANKPFFFALKVQDTILFNGIYEG